MTLPANAALQQEVEAADDERIRALVQSDFAALEAVHADDLVYVHSTAYTESKPSLLKGMRAGRVRFIGVSRSDVRVREFGNILLMDCKVAIEFEMGGTRRTAHSNIVSAWVRRDRRLQMVHYHSTTIPQK